MRGGGRFLLMNIFHKENAMSNLPLVSVILLVYNGEETISITLDSILGQTYENFETILIDDASTLLINNAYETYIFC